MDIERLRVGTKIEVNAPYRGPKQIGTGVGIIQTIVKNGLWITMNESSFSRTFFTFPSTSYTFKVLKY